MIKHLVSFVDMLSMEELKNFIKMSKIKSGAYKYGIYIRLLYMPYFQKSELIVPDPANTPLCHQKRIDSPF